MPSADLGLSRGGKGESEMADVMIGILRLMFQGDGQGSIIAADQGFLKNKHRRAIGCLHMTVAGPAGFGIRLEGIGDWIVGLRVI